VRRAAGPSAPRAPTPQPPERAWGAWWLGFLAVAGVSGSLFGWSGGCKHEPPPGAEIAPSSAVAAESRAGLDVDAGAAPLEHLRDSAARPTAAYEPPLIGAFAPQAPIYSGMEALRDKRIGYLRQGGKAPVDPTPIRAANCEAGWYHLLAGGYLCGKFATLDLNHPQVRLGTTPPNLEDILPYRYAWNTTRGTPLYKSVPSRDAMLEYEPYLKAKRHPSEASELQPVAVDNLDNPYAPSLPLSATEPSPDLKRPWWQQTTDADGGKPEIKLSDLTEGADAVVAKRMVKGFYVAIDKSFPWHDRTWYRTTASLVAPADRFALNKPTGFVLSTTAQKYAVDDKGRPAPLGPVGRFTTVRLTSRTVASGTTSYRETTEGWWMRGSDGTYTEPGPPPAGLLAGEKWIDVNLSRQTLVAFQGDAPVYATLVSTGRKARDPDDKVHDHQTIQGNFRIREKHIAITMDGDGPAPGDMPYSIEDVPYVMYFEGSYALHGAFWHSNFGRPQSHGCVNLAPLDAKQLFFWSEPQLPQGWHGVLATRERLGTRVVVHE
jgi:lipoprotein-anchoring transpeptidase ErfK/SrfK